MPFSKNTEERDIPAFSACIYGKYIVYFYIPYKLLYLISKSVLQAHSRMKGIKMKRIQSLEEIKQNIFVLDGYLDEKRETEYSFALSLIKKGTCFLAVKSEFGYKFYPSRFIGYSGNTMDKHLNNIQKDGRLTTPAISKVLNQVPSFNPNLEREYNHYCEHLGFTANAKGTYGVGRKYWELMTNS